MKLAQATPARFLERFSGRSGLLGPFRHYPCGIDSPLGSSAFIPHAFPQQIRAVATNVTSTGPEQAISKMMPRTCIPF